MRSVTGCGEVSRVVADGDLRSDPLRPDHIARGGWAGDQGAAATATLRLLTGEERRHQRQREFTATGALII
jgi:hypothetical protein